MRLKKKYNPTDNIVHVISLSCSELPPKKYGGTELVVSNLCEGLTDLGANVLCYSPGSLRLKRVSHVRTLETPSSAFGEGGQCNTPEHLSIVCQELRKRLSAGDVVLFNHVDHYNYLKSRLGILNRVRAHFYEIAHWIDVGMKSNIVYPSARLAHEVSRHGTVIPHGERLLFKDPADEVMREDFLFFAGRITPDKGIDIALEAARNIGVQLVLAGPQVDTTFAEPIVSDPAVTYLGDLTHEELFGVYRRCKALVYMSQYTEPFGLAVIEAMAAGAPVITTGRGGTGETVIDGKTGFFASSAADIASAYQKLHLISEDACVARAREYTVERMAQQYLQLFIHGQPRPSAPFA
jgi:glycosyltransferase involved in cell wall biosynthesis